MMFLYSSGGTQDCRTSWSSIASRCSVLIIPGGVRVTWHPERPQKGQELQWTQSDGGTLKLRVVEETQSSDTGAVGHWVNINCQLNWNV